MYNLQQFYTHKENSAKNEIAKLTYENKFFKQYCPSNNIYHYLDEYINQADQLIKENKTVEEVKSNPTIDNNVKTIFDIRSR